MTNAKTDRFPFDNFLRSHFCPDRRDFGFEQRHAPDVIEGRLAGVERQRGQVGDIEDVEDVEPVVVRPGELGRYCRKLSAAGVDISTAYVMKRTGGETELIFAVDDLQAAKEA